MNPHIVVTGSTCWRLPEKISHLAQDEIKFFKSQYIVKLIHSSEIATYAASHLKQVLLEKTIEELAALHLVLENIFTPACSNSERVEIVKFLTKANQDQWTDIIQQVCFIMPIGTRGHDVMWAIEILSSISSQSLRTELVHTANRLFNYQTQTVERGYILQALMELSLSEMRKLDKAEESERIAFVNKHVPANLKEGREIIVIYDPVLNTEWMKV